MSSAALWNIGALVLALAVSVSTVWRSGHGNAAPPPASTFDHAARPALVDHAGVTVPRANYTRIASVSTVADAILIELCEPDRIVSFTAYSAKSSTASYRFEGKPVIDGVGDLEKLIALRPDLVLVSGLTDRRPIARLREAGLTVYDLGDLRGVATLVPNIHEVAELIGHPERGDRLANAFAASMAAVASDVPESSRKRGVYLSVYGGHFYGGAAGTSYHDVLASAGLLDAAAAYHDWPEYSVEQVLALDPDVIVTNSGMRERVCGHEGLTGLRACADAAAFVVLDDGLLGDPGPAMLEAAQLVRRAVYGPPDSSGRTGRGP